MYTFQNTVRTPVLLFHLLLNGIMWLHIVNINKAEDEIWILAVIDHSLNLILVDAMI